MRRNKVYDYYNEHAKRSDPADFWGQVKRSVNGKVVGQEQIDMIVAAIVAGLEMHPYECLLDLCCGNGVLSDKIFEHCAGGVGVDFADYLIEVARKHFEQPSRTYVLDDVETYVTTATNTDRFTDVLCYSSFQYFSPEAALTILRAIHDRFPNVSSVYLGNLPDYDRIDNFFLPANYIQGIESEYESSIGLWRTKSQFATLAKTGGWKTRFKDMPSNFYASHYRYDAILTRR